MDRSHAMKWFCAVVCMVCTQLWAQTSDLGYVVEQRTQWVAVLTDPALIHLFVDEFYITEDTITEIEIIDANNNGFTRGDLIKVYPSEEIYFIDEPSEHLQNEMDKWKFQANFRLTVEHSRTPDILEQQPFRKAEHAILASFIRGLNRNYKGWPLKAWVERDSLGITLEMWGYSDSQLEYEPPPPAGYDVVHVYKVMADTVYIPQR